jgi:hypothetical protein
MVRGIRRGTLSVFVCYRREDDRFLPGRLSDVLAGHFGERNVFYDIDAIQPGDDFREVIRSQLDQVDAVLALIGPRWDTARLREPNDFVQAELHEALRQDKVLIPVLVGDAKMPPSTDFPTELEPVSYLQAARVRPDPDFDDDSARLISAIERSVDEKGRRPRPPPPPWLPVALGAAAVALVVLALGAWLLLGSGSDAHDSSDTTVSVTGGPPGPVSTPVTVDGTQPWTDTGIDVAKGDRVEVTASGQVFHNQFASTGPEGIPNDPGLATPLPSANHAGLLGRITADGGPFYVGAQDTFIADRDGRLLLGINDGGLENNRGHWDATVTVSGN